MAVKILKIPFLFLKKILKNSKMVRSHCTNTENNIVSYSAEYIVHDFFGNDRRDISDQVENEILIFVENIILTKISLF